MSVIVRVHIVYYFILLILLTLCFCCFVYSLFICEKIYNDFDILSILRHNFLQEILPEFISLIILYLRIFYIPF